MMLQLPVCMLVLMWWLSDEGCCLDVPQVRVKTKTCLGGQVRQKAFVETLMLMPQSHPSQWARGARSPFQHMLLGRRRRAIERTFRVVDVSAIIGPAMVVRAPADHDDERDPEVDTFYLSEYHMQGARYHGGPSDEAYLKFIDIHRVDTNMPAADAEDSD